jgi:ribosomal protein L12E/L44/L45/RPP1/RPP2
MNINAGNGSVRRHVFLDNCRIHDSPKLALELLAHNIVLWYLPKNTSHFSQPLDVFTIAAIKSIHRSSFRAVAESAARSNVPADPSASVHYLVTALMDPRLRQATKKSFFKTDIVGVKFDADAASALGDMRAKDGKRARTDTPRIQVVRGLLEATLSVIERVQCADGAKVAAINNSLVPTVPIRKGSFCNALEVAESARAVAGDELNVSIAEQSTKIEKARNALESALRRCRACNTIKTATAIDAKWLHCECGEYIVCVKCAERSPPLPAAALRLSHCKDGVPVVQDNDTIQTCRLKLNDALQVLEQRKRELDAVTSVGHTPTGRRTRATENARASKLTGRGVHALLGLCDTVIDPAKVRARIVMVRSAVPQAADLLKAAQAVKRAAPGAEPASKAPAAKRKRARGAANDEDDEADEDDDSEDDAAGAFAANADNSSEDDPVLDEAMPPPPLHAAPPSRLSQRANLSAVGDPIGDAIRNAVGRSSRSVPMPAPWRAHKS